MVGAALLLPILMHTINIHTLPDDRLEVYQKTLATAYKGVPEIKIELKAEVKYEHENK